MLYLTFIIRHDLISDRILHNTFNQVTSFLVFNFICRFFFFWIWPTFSSLQLPAFVDRDESRLLGSLPAKDPCVIQFPEVKWAFFALIRCAWKFHPTLSDCLNGPVDLPASRFLEFRSLRKPIHLAVHFPFLFDDFPLRFCLQTIGLINCWV